MGNIPQTLNPMMTNSHNTGLRRTRRATRVHKFPDLGPRDPIPQCRDPHQRLVRLAPNLNRHVFRHGTQRNQPKSAAMVLPLRDRDFPRADRDVLDLVPHQSHSNGRIPVRLGVFKHFYNGINEGTEKQASDAYCWIISILFGAWVFYGYDASVHLAEETHEASEVVAKGMWMSTLSAWVMSVPTLIIILFCIQDFDDIIAGTCANNWAEYLVQLVGPNGAVAILSLLWVDSTCATASCFMSAQRVTYDISRDGILPGNKYFRRLSKKSHMPIHAAWLVLAMSVVITTAVIGSVVAFSAITAAATIATNVSYLFPTLARHTVGRHSFEPAKWNLGRWTVPCAVVSGTYISFLCVVLLLPQLYPVTG
jgi:amino acid transporter